jgi:hypothetical protein
MSDQLLDKLRLFVKALDAFKASLDKHTEAIREATETNKHTQSDQAPTPRFVNDKIILPPAIPAYYEAEQRERPNKTRWERIKRGVEFVTLVVAIGLAVLTYYTLCQVTKQANAALDANHISRENLTSVQRAFVYMNGFSIFPASQSQKTGFVFTTMWANSGSTQALSRTYYINFISPDKPIQKGNAFCDYDASGKVVKYSAVSSGFLAAHANEGAATRIFVEDSLAAAVNASKRYLYIYGWTRYTDVFRNTPRRVTMFCKQIVSFGKVPVSSTVPSMILWNDCEEHNCADDECAEYEKRKQQCK